MILSPHLGMPPVLASVSPCRIALLGSVGCGLITPAVGPARGERRARARAGSCLRYQNMWKSEIIWKSNCRRAPDSNWNIDFVSTQSSATFHGAMAYDTMPGGGAALQRVVLRHRSE